MSTNLSDIYAANRAEELGFNVWDEFVEPPFYAKLGIGVARKPKVIIGGRGCGKTMLLRFLAHESTFSASNETISLEALNHIGLYWKADTQFASSMQQRGIPDDTWKAAFRHLIAIVVGIEILRSIESIATSHLKLFTLHEVSNTELNGLQAFGEAMPTTVGSLRETLEQRLIEFEIWVNDVRGNKQPQLFPGKVFLHALIKSLCRAFPKLDGAVFFVYVDEYENLAIYQQKVINTLLKHSELPLIFNLAMKRNGFKNRSTEGDESLSAIHDYRELDIEDFQSDAEFALFAAEILLLRLRHAEKGGLAGLSSDLSSVPGIEARGSAGYRERVIGVVKDLFPEMSQSELAQGVLKDKTLRKRLEKRILDALAANRQMSIPTSEFILDEHPEEAIVVPALLHRKGNTPQSVLSEISKLRSGKANKFTGPTNWTHNNFVGCYLQVFDGLTRACPFYSGFGSFCSMSRGNLRHFLELCFKAIAREAIGSIRSKEDKVDAHALAARAVSADLLSEVRSFGLLGNSLHTFVLRLGSLLSLSQQRLTQSEPECTHFSVAGNTVFEDQETEFLSESVKWSVLFEERGTKKKSETEPEGIEYVLNPIYAPYFHISYRKRRRLVLSEAELTALIKGDYKRIRQLLRDYQQKWSLDPSYLDLPLFSHLREVDE